MAGIFGCVSGNCDSKFLGSVLEQNVDISRGAISKFYCTSDVCLGIQSEYPKESYCVLESGNDFCFAFLSDFPRTTSRIMYDKMKKWYLKKGIYGLQEALIQQSSDDFLLLLYDVRKKELFITSDPFGIRRIFYANTLSGIFFSTSLNHLVRATRALELLERTIVDEELDIEALISYLLHGSVPHKKTIFRRIQKTIPANVLLLKEQGNSHTVRSVCLPFASKHTKPIDDDPLNDYSIITKCVKERIDENLANGVLLSGGLDSGVIASILSRCMDGQKIVALTLCYDGYYDESSAAQKVADFLGLRLVKKVVPRDDAYLLQMFRESVSLMEEPSARTSYLSRYIAFKAIREYSSTVWLGEGGDEIFVGYTPITWKFDDNPLIRLLSIFSPKILNQLADMSFALSKSKCEYVDVVKYCNLARKERLLFKLISGSTSISRTVEELTGLRIDFESLLRNNYRHSFNTTLKKFNSLDKISRESLLLLTLLAESDVMVDESYTSRLNLKLKLPFLDRELVRRFLGMSSDQKLVGNITKYRLRQMALSFNLLPKTTILGSKSWFLSPAFFIKGERLAEHITETASFLASETRSRFIRKFASTVQKKVSKDNCGHYANAITLIEFLSRFV